MNNLRRKQMTEAMYAHVGEAIDPLCEIKKDLEGWREVMIPLASLLRWDKPYYPAITAGLVTFIFLFIWYAGLSAITTISLVFMVIGIVDFLVPYMGPTITGLKTWTGSEETEFSNICEHLQNIQQDMMDTWLGLSAMRQQNPKSFFFVTMGFLSATAWIGNLMDNLFLTYLIVVLVLMLPGLRQHSVINKYLQPVFNILAKLRQGAQPKMKDN